MKKPVILLILLLLAFTSKAQRAHFSPALKTALSDAAHLRYPALQRKLKEARQQDPENRVPDYLEAATLCIRLFLNENEATYEGSEDRLDYLIERIEDLPEKEPYRGVFLGEINLALAALEGKYQNNVRAAWLFYRAYNILEENHNQNPNFVPNYVPWGVLRAGIGSLPNDYKSIASFLGFQGSIEEGLKLVRNGYYQCMASSDYSFYQPYFAFVYAYIHHQLEGNEQVDLEKLGLRVGESSFFIYLQTKILLDKGQALQAYQLLKSRPQGPGYLEFPYIDYHTGKVALMVKPHEARPYLEKFLLATKSQSYVKSAYRFLAWYYLLENKPDSVALMKSKINSEGDTFVGADKQALDESQRGFNEPLIRARLDFDGGRYPEIIRNLNTKVFQNSCRKDWEKTEFYYRRGRAFQEMGLNEKAMVEYEKALALNPAQKTYALGNSALQLATLFEKSGQEQLAAEYYHRALQIKDFPFYEGIHQKAKTGLSRIE